MGDFTSEQLHQGDWPETRANGNGVQEGFVASGGTTHVQILSEPLAYGARLVRDPRGPYGLRAISTSTPRSYVRDLASYTRKTGDWQGAGERLLRHEREMADVWEKREALMAPGASYEFETRAPGWAAGSGGYFAPPLWIVEQFAGVPTPERVLSAMAPSFDLPLGVQSVNVPRFTAGADVSAPQIGAPAAEVGLTDAVASSPVATIAGNEDVPMQILEQSPVGAHLDWAVFANMEARYGYRLEQQMVAGAGTTGEATRTGNDQILGILDNTAIPSSNVLAYTDATPSVKNLVETSGASQGGVVAMAIAAIGNTRKVKPEVWLMTTSRAAWIASGELAFPLAVSNQTGPGAFDLLAYPVAEDDAIPTTLGATANQDTIIACRPSDWLVLESEPRTSVFMETLSGVLMARLQLGRYVAAVLRFPSSVAYIQGTGMVVQAGF